MLGLLGLYKDENELKHDNYYKMEKRQWRTSKIDAFGSNLAFVLYKYLIYLPNLNLIITVFFVFIFRCNDNTSKILTLHQEKIIQLNGCDVDLCPYDKFKQLFETDLKNCDFNQMCDID